MEPTFSHSHKCHIRIVEKVHQRCSRQVDINMEMESESEPGSHYGQGDSGICVSTTRAGFEQFENEYESREESSSNASIEILAYATIDEEIILKKEGDIIIGSFSIGNQISKPIIFKVKSIDPDAFLVGPVIGQIEPELTASVQVQISPTYQKPVNPDFSSKFAIYVIPSPEEIGEQVDEEMENEEVIIDFGLLNTKFKEWEKNACSQKYFLNASLETPEEYEPEPKEQTEVAQECEVFLLRDPWPTIDQIAKSLKILFQFILFILILLTIICALILNYMLALEKLIDGIQHEKNNTTEEIVPEAGIQWWKLLIYEWKYS